MDPLSKISVRKTSVGCLNLMSPKPTSPINYSKVNNYQNRLGKSKSLPAHSSMKNLNTIQINVQCISPEELANQLTLLDFAVFKSIQSEELSSCAWTKKDKHFNTPNIVALTKRFNHTSFWIVQEVLSIDKPKARAELLSHFIKMAKKLHQLNNLHSLFAVVSALQSASIYRLEKTWSCLPKRDKQTFDRLREIFSDENNWRNLRNYLESLRLPCIPYLGLFLTDLIYIDMAYPHVGSYFEPSQRRNKMNNILRVISNYQQSNYNYLEANKATQKYIKSICYIEELQNIFEEDQYKKSLLLEPMRLSVPKSGSSASKESVKIETLTISLAHLNSSPAKTNGSPLHIDHSTKYTPGHRKCSSLGTNIFWKLNLNENTAGKTSDERHEVHSKQRHLIDDSVLETNCFSNKEEENSIEDSAITLNRLESCVFHLPINENAIIQGFLRRKTLQKQWRKPTLAHWQRYWLQLWSNYLIYFLPKSFKGCERNDFKLEPYKVCPLEGWYAKKLSNTKEKCTFELYNKTFGTIYKFRTKSLTDTNLWTKYISSINEEHPPLKSHSINLMSFE